MLIKEKADFYFIFFFAFVKYLLMLFYIFRFKKKKSSGFRNENADSFIYFYSALPIFQYWDFTTISQLLVIFWNNFKSLSHLKFPVHYCSGFSWFYYPYPIFVELCSIWSHYSHISLHDRFLSFLARGYEDNNQTVQPCSSFDCLIIKLLILSNCWNFCNCIEY